MLSELITSTRMAVHLQNQDSVHKTLKCAQRHSDRYKLSHSNTGLNDKETL